MPGLYSHTTRSTGTTLTAAIYNGDHQNHIDNATPQQHDDYSTNAAQMQSTVDPGEASSESLPTSLAGELERLRFAIQEIKSVLGLTSAQWYSTATGSLSSSRVAQADFALPGDITPTQLTGNVNDYAPTGLSTATVLRLSSDASRNITSITGGADGRVLVLHNIGAQNIVLTDDDGATGTAANRFALTASVTLQPDQVAAIQYDSTSTRWRLIGDIVPSASDTVAGRIELAIQSEMETGTDVLRAVTPGRQHFHAGHPKAWGKAQGDGAAVLASYNIAGLVDNSAGNVTWTIATDFSSGDWAGFAFSGNTGDGTSRIPLLQAAQTAGTFTVETRTTGGVASDPTEHFFLGLGDQA